MRLIFAVLALALVVFGQATPKRILPDEAAKHLIHRTTPSYPSVAEAARIQGNIILEIGIDEFGAAHVRRLVTGHPLLVPAAIESVNHWKYQPFEVDGKPATVVTFATVTFGNPGKENDAAMRTEILFQNTFWTAEEEAQAALAKGDYTDADQQLNRAQGALAPVSDGSRHESERWQWTISMGSLAMAQQKYDEAELYYKKAKELRQNGDKDAPEMAATLANLGRLYAEEKRYDLARDHAARSLAIYQKNFKRVGSSHSGAREVYGRAIAYQSWMLSKIALQQNDHVEVGKQCRVVLEFQTFLGTADHDSFVSACEQAVKNPTPHTE